MESLSRKGPLQAVGRHRHQRLTMYSGKGVSLTIALQPHRILRLLLDLETRPQVLLALKGSSSVGTGERSFQLLRYIQAAVSAAGGSKSPTMHFLEAEGGWSLSFAGSGFLGLYHVGATQCLHQRAPRILQGARCFYGSSAGALNAMTIVCGMSTDYSCSNLLGMVKHVERLSLGIFHPAYGPIEHIRKQLQDTLPDNCHILASQRLGISMTRWPDGKNRIVTDFATKDELIQALICSLYFPLYCGTIPPAFRGERYIDGALSNNLPFSHSPTTITISPFHGTADICPQSNSGSLYELTAFNASFQISTKNFFQGFISLIPPKPEVVADYCRQGYLDALRFLERRGLTKEPVLWSLVSKEPPALMEGPRSADCDQGQKLTLTIRWDIPNVLVKDVPEFELLSPELEAALRKACQRDFWARFQCSVPGRALTYLLLPCTLPFEYVYFRSRRLLLWLPDMPADLCWMQGLLKSTAREVYSMAKSQLLRLVSPPVTSADSGPRQLGTAASENRALNLRLASRAMG